MFHIDPRVQARIARHIERVLVVDPNPASTYLLIDVLRGIGARNCVQATTTKRALQICAEWHPQLVFIEFAGQDLDGVEFTSRLRRSSMTSRRVPVIIVTSDTREASIKAARDAGAHEFLCKPFTAGNVFRRVENVSLKPRPWVEAGLYVGPERRRFNSGAFEGKRKRQADGAAAAANKAFVEAEVTIRAQLELLTSAPQAALRHMMEQTFELQKAAGTKPGEGDLGKAIDSFQKYLVSVIDQTNLQPEIVLSYLDAISDLRDKTPRDAAPVEMMPPERALSKPVDKLVSID